MSMRSQRGIGVVVTSVLNFGASKRPLRSPRRQAATKVADDRLDLAEHAEVGALVDLGPRGRIGAADDHGHARGAAALDHLDRAVGLRQHAARHHHVGRGDLGVGKFIAIEVDEPKAPVLRQHRRDRQQAERRRRCPRAGDLAGVLQGPERIRVEARKHEEDSAAIGAGQSGRRGRRGGLDRHEKSF